MSYTSLIATAVMEHCARRGVHLAGEDFDRLLAVGRALDIGAIDAAELGRIAKLPRSAMLAACDRIDDAGIVDEVDAWLLGGAR